MRRARIQDHATRGKTAPNRLRRLDVWVCRSHRRLFLARPGGLFLDLGFGRVPRTTVETAEHLWRVDPTVRVVGVERDPERVAAAQEDPRAGIRYLLGGFDVDPGSPVRFLRAMNVLRQYSFEAVTEARVSMGMLLDEGGLLMEGTCSPFGRLIAVRLFRRKALELLPDGVLFAFRIGPDFHPRDLQTVLPKDLMDKVVPGEPVHAFFETWARCWDGARHWSAYGPRAVFRESLPRLQQQAALDTDPWLGRHAYVHWRPAEAPLPLPRFA